MTLHLIASVLLLIFAAPTQQPATSAPIVPSSTRAQSTAETHHTCLAQERSAFENGEGFGMAMAAEQNGYPGPRHVLDRKAELNLGPEQEASMQALFGQMKDQAIAKGREILQAEKQLADMFAQGRPESQLREQVLRIESLRAELRWIHLSAHMAARRLLSPEQLLAYRTQDHSQDHQAHGAPNKE
jgi:hypothetical protein